jgi:OOP family OmpA-OmpF porin
MQHSNFARLMAAAACGLALTSIPAQAQWYAGATIGSSDARLDEGANAAFRFTAAGFSSAASSTDKRDTAGRVFGGYQIKPWLGVELGYTDLGNYSLQTNASAGSAGVGSLTNEIKIKGAEAAVVGRWSASEQLAVLARVGAFDGDAKSFVQSSGSVSLLRGDTANYRERETIAVFGLGAEYRLTKRVWLRADWSHYDRINTIDALGVSRESNIDLYSIGVVARF